MPEAMIAELIIDGLNAAPKLIALYGQVKGQLSANTQASIEAAIATAKDACTLDVAQAVSDANAAAV